MSTHSACNEIANELFQLETSLRRIVKNFDRIDEDVQSEFLPLIIDLRIIIEELSERIDSIHGRECQLSDEGKEILLHQKREEWRSSWENLVTSFGERAIEHYFLPEKE